MSGMENRQMEVIDNVQAYQEYNGMLHNLLEYETAGMHSILYSMLRSLMFTLPCVQGRW